MFRRCNDRTHHAPRDARPHAEREEYVTRRGMMLAELLIATAILTMIVGTMAMLAQAVQQNSDYGDGHGEAAQARAGHAGPHLPQRPRGIGQRVVSRPAGPLDPGGRLAIPRYAGRLAPGALCEQPAGSA